MRSCVRFALALLASAPALLHAADIPPAQIYKQNCALCHDSGGERMPNRQALANLSPETVVRALTTGAMRFQGSYLTSAQRVSIAEFLTNKTLGQTTASAGLCPGAPPAALTSGPQWNGWGVDLENSRFQTASAAGFTAAQIPNLKLKWAFGFPGDSVAFAQPTLAGGRVFVGSAGGRVYSLDAKTGCTYWSFDAGAGVRTAIIIGPGNLAYFGDFLANAYALDANTGKLVWKTHVDEHPYARVTGTPKLFEGRLYVPLSSHEEWTSSDPRYECCTFRGVVAALDAKTGKQIWKTYTIAEAPRRTKKNPIGTQMWGPSGAGVWMSPTIDPKRRVLYIGTGDDYSDPAAPTSDSIMALDLATGKIVWTRQITAGDTYNNTCLADKVNCPDNPGPDVDFGASLILRTLPSGRTLIIAGQKSGVVHALDVDKKGAEVWQSRLGVGGVLGGIQWGPAADQTAAYVALSDLDLMITDANQLAAGGGYVPNPNKGGGLFALQLATGEKLWTAPSPGIGCKEKGCSPSQSAAVSGLPGAVFSGSLDGHFRAYSTATGKVLWDYDTLRSYDTVNKTPARGGSLDAGGAAIAGGMVLVNSGYGYFNAIPGNVLLAFGLD